MFVPTQVGQRVLAKDHSRKFFEAFISAVHTDGTYNVYFPEDPQKPGINVKPNTIKIPFLTPRQVDYGNWKCYVGKTFYDKGTEPDSDDDEDVEPFEAGEFIVKAVTTGNNYICERVGSSED